MYTQRTFSFSLLFRELSPEQLNVRTRELYSNFNSFLFSRRDATYNSAALAPTSYLSRASQPIGGEDIRTVPLRWRRGYSLRAADD